MSECNGHAEENVTLSEPGERPESFEEILAVGSVELQDAITRAISTGQNQLVDITFLRIGQRGTYECHRWVEVRLETSAELYGPMNFQILILHYASLDSDLLVDSKPRSMFDLPN